MLFTSGEFVFVYLPVVLAGFFVVARLWGQRLAAGWLAGASMFFYGFWRLEDVPLLALSIVFNYAAGRYIQTRRPSQASARGTALTLAIAVNLLVLAYFKYANFIVGSVNAVTALDLRHVDVVLPIGISFFTFTQIAYLVDSHAGKVTERNPVHYALFVTYFPHLISGPVLHHAEMMPQFAQRETYRPRLDNLVIGLAFVLIGMFKKVIVADSAAPVANALFDVAGMRDLGPAEAWQGVLAYTVQIYYDFSGYSDMAVGLSILFGIRLPYNFDSPYKSRSIIDFWRRWHMTLSRFLRDYLYIALGGNRRGPIRRYVNLAMTMLLGGLWHGASWTFVVWGGLHGAYLVANHGWRHLAERWARTWSWWSHPLARRTGQLLSLALTLLAVMVAWVFFRAADFHGATAVLAAMAGATPAEGTWSAAPDTTTAVALLAALLLTILAPNSQQLIDGTLRRRLEAARGPAPGGFWRAAAASASVAGIAMLAFISASRAVSEFIYFNF